MSVTGQAMEDRVSNPFRVLFCMGVGASFFEAAQETREEVLRALVEAFSDLRGRFGVEVLGTLDDDRLRIVPSAGWPWTAYILADVPRAETAIEICNLMRETRVGESQLSRYTYLEARVGRRLFFGNE